MLLFISFLAFTLTACKKDYPKDIPKWIKEKIKIEKRNSNYYWIDEYSIGDSIIYKEAGSPYVITTVNWNLLDQNGNYICGYGAMTGSTCYSLINRLVFRRKIWHDDPKKGR